MGKHSLPRILIFQSHYLYFWSILNLLFFGYTDFVTAVKQFKFESKYDFNDAQQRKNLSLPSGQFISILGNQGKIKQNMVRKIVQVSDHQEDHNLYDQPYPRMMLYRTSNQTLPLVQLDLPLSTVSNSFSISDYDISSRIAPPQSYSAALLNFIFKHSTLIIVPIDEREIKLDPTGNKLSIPASLKGILESNTEANFTPIILLILKDKSKKIESNLYQNEIQKITGSKSPPFIISIDNQQDLQHSSQKFHSLFKSILSSKEIQQEHSGLLNRLNPLIADQFMTANVASEVHIIRNLYQKYLRKSQIIFDEWSENLINGKLTEDLSAKYINSLNHYANQFSWESSFYGSTTLHLQLKAELLKFIQDQTKFFFFRQLLIVERDIRKALKTHLLRETTQGKLPSSEEKAKAIEQCIRMFKKEINSLRLTDTVFGDKIDLALNNLIDQLQKSLETYAENFDKTSVAQLKAQGRMPGVGEIESATKKEKKRGIRMGLALTAMLRQNGYGNLQGFTHYDAGPLTLTFGYSNDRDLPESSWNGNKPPFFRLQPKIHFDIDL